MLDEPGSPAGRRLKRRTSSAAIVEACKSSDVNRIERALTDGLDAGVSDEELIYGILRLDEVKEEKQREAAQAEQKARAERARMVAEEEAERARTRRPPREGSLVRLHSLTTAHGFCGMGKYDLTAQNGRIGRVVDVLGDEARFLVKTAAKAAPVGDKAVLTTSSANVNAGDPNRLVTVHTGTRNTDLDRRHGLWLAVPIEYAVPLTSR